MSCLIRKVWHCGIHLGWLHGIDVVPLSGEIVFCYLIGLLLSF